MVCFLSEEIRERKSYHGKEASGNVWEDFTAVRYPAKFGPTDLVPREGEGESSVLMKPRIHRPRGGRVCVAVLVRRKRAWTVSWKEFVFSGTCHVFLTSCLMVSLVFVRFALGGEAAWSAGTMLGVVPLFVSLTKRFNSSDICVVDVT